MVVQRVRVAGEVASTSFRFPETKSAHLEFFPLSDYNLRRLICLHAMYLFVRNRTRILTIPVPLRTKFCLYCASRRDLKKNSHCQTPTAKMRLRSVCGRTKPMPMLTTRILTRKC